MFQDAYGEQPLGTVDVASAGAAGGFWTATASRIVLPLATLAAALLLAVQVRWLLRDRRQPAAAGIPAASSTSGD